jgi:hypothetical protein
MGLYALYVAKVGGAIRVHLSRTLSGFVVNDPRYPCHLRHGELCRGVVAA